MAEHSNDRDYYLRLELTDDPFVDNAADSNIYLTPQINSRLKRIRNHLASGQGVLLVSGMRGSGKSLLAEKLKVLRQDDWNLSLVHAEAGVDVESLSRQILGDLTGEKGTVAGQSVSLLHKHLETSFRGGITPVIIIDNAYQLNVDTLQFIFQLAQVRYNEAQFRIVLFSDSSIEDQLEKPALSELSRDLTERVSLPAFTREQLSAYLQFRVSRCGNWEQLPFTEEDFDYIHKASGGLPGGINILARATLQEKLKPGTGGKGYTGLLLLLLVLVLAAGALLFYQDFSRREAGDPGGGSGSQARMPVQPAEGGSVTDEVTTLPGLNAVPKDSLSLKLSDVLQGEERENNRTE